MPETDIESSVASDLTNALPDYSVSAEDTDGAQAQKETEWMDDKWTKSYGYYNSIPEFKTSVDAKARWTIGAGFETDEPTLMLLNNIKGNGKDSFNSILENQIKVKTLSRVSYAEIIRDKDGVLVNLKPLNPGVMKVFVNQKGRIIRFEQIDKTKKPIHKFKPEEIFYLVNGRIADEIGGTRILDSLQWLIDARHEVMTDWKKVLHTLIKPKIIWHLDTDDPDKIAAFKTKNDAASADNENIYIPKGTVVPEVVAVAVNQTLNPITWINQLNDYFFQAVNVPQIVIGGAKEFTDASAKIVYLAYEQSVKAEQLYIEEQVLNQLNISIALTFPATLQNELISSREKDPNIQANQPNDTTAELEGQT